MVIMKMMIYCQRVLFVAIRCPTLQVLNSDPPSVTCSATDNRVNSNCAFKYPAGYQLKGSQVRVCQSDKTCSGNALELQRPEKVLDF